MHPAVWEHFFSRLHATGHIKCNPTLASPSRRYFRVRARQWSWCTAEWKREMRHGTWRRTRRRARLASSLTMGSTLLGLGTMPQPSFGSHRLRAPCSSRWRCQNPMASWLHSQHRVAGRLQPALLQSRPMEPRRELLHLARRYRRGQFVCSPRAGGWGSRPASARALSHTLWGSPRSTTSRFTCGLWPMVRHTAVLERYAALWCLWHGVRVVGRSNR
jgi:hypothetical protein